MHLNSLTWSPGKVAGCIIPMDFQRQARLLSHCHLQHWQCSFPRWHYCSFKGHHCTSKGETAASFSSFCSLQVSLCLLLPNIQQYSLWNGKVAQSVERQKILCLSPATFGSMVCCCWHLCSGHLFHAQYGIASPGAIPFPWQRCISSFFMFSVAFSC